MDCRPMTTILLITRGQDAVSALPADSKQAWFSGICTARQLYLESEACEIVTGSMQTFMLHWLSAGD